MVGQNEISKGRHARRCQPLLMPVGVGALWALSLSACSTDIFDVKVELMAESFQVDFGAAMGSIPAVPCSAETAANCGTGQAIALAEDSGAVTLTPGCSLETSRCYVQADAVARYTVDVLEDEEFTSKVARKSVSAVRMLDITYQVPSNTTTFDIPAIDVLVGPVGSRTTTDAGVFLIDRVDPLAAGAVIRDEPRHLTVGDGSPARGLIETSIKSKSPFVVLLAMTPRLESGTPLPAGQLRIDLNPILGLGLR